MKKQMSIIAVYAIIFVIFNVFYYAIPFPKGGAAWTMYAFSLISMVAGFFMTRLAFKGDTALKSKVYGYPVFRVGVIYGTVQIGLSIIVFAVNSFVDVPVWIPVIMSVLIMGLAGIGLIAVDNARDVIESEDEAIAAATKTITYFNINMGGILDRCSDADLKKKLEGLAEEFRYSDPVSNEALTDIEAEIRIEIDKLSALVDAGGAEAENQIAKLKNMLASRNRICKATK